MKKVLISVLLVLLTLCLFVSCSSSPKVKEEPTPTTNTISVYDIENPSTLKFTFDVDLNNTKRWSEISDEDHYTDNMDEGQIYFDGSSVVYDNNGCYTLYTDTSQTKLSEDILIKETPNNLFILLF